MISAVSILASLIVGLVIGVLSGMLGIGGGTIMIPVFKLGFGMAPAMCAATSLFAVVLTAISGSITHIRNKTCVPKLGLALGLGGAATSPLGVWLGAISPDWAIMVAATLVIAYSAITMFQKAWKMKPAKAGQIDAKISAPSDSESAADESAADESASESAAAESAADESTADPAISAREMAIGVCIGIVAGVASGYVGIGGGFLMVPMLMQLLKLPMRLTSGTSLLAVMILPIPGVIMQGFYGNVNWIAGILVSLGTVPGAFIGARLINRIHERALRFLFSGFLMVAAILLLVDQLYAL
ncbi:sulfite exporter TauE/SafE family protein [Adlercreutzia sp. ZJ304]|uniref:sulfite exporter TauE/SafE family protein n=1 Tax=Adlercreutzia sp. ZJ304 TaxID=2709791 RepID=UPI0013EB268A|nr:sulfite exporter TauE/SafE family protein [Adlercreutzia sp. ZJ304]